MRALMVVGLVVLVGCGQATVDEGGSPNPDDAAVEMVTEIRIRYPASWPIDDADLIEEATVVCAQFDAGGNVDEVLVAQQARRPTNSPEMMEVWGAVVGAAPQYVCPAHLPMVEAWVEEQLDDAQ